MRWVALRDNPLAFVWFISPQTGCFHIRFDTSDNLRDDIVRLLRQRLGRHVSQRVLHCTIRNLQSNEMCDTHKHFIFWKSEQTFDTAFVKVGTPICGDVFISYCNGASPSRIRFSNASITDNACVSARDCSPFVCACCWSNDVKFTAWDMVNVVCRKRLVTENVDKYWRSNSALSDTCQRYQRNILFFFLSDENDTASVGCQQWNTQWARARVGAD